LGGNRAELKTHVNKRDKNQMNRTAKEAFGLELESHTDDTFKRKKQTMLVNERLIEGGNGYSMMSKKASEVAK